MIASPHIQWHDLPEEQKTATMAYFQSPARMMTMPYNAYIAIRIIDNHENILGAVTYGDPVRCRVGDCLYPLVLIKNKSCVNDVNVKVDIKLYRDLTEALKDPCTIRATNQILQIQFPHHTI